MEPSIPPLLPELITGLANEHIIYYEVGSKNSCGMVWSGTYHYPALRESLWRLLGGQETERE